MVGTEEKRTTYPHFMLTKEGELLYHYRDGGSGNGNEIYNRYSTDSKQWSRMLDVPLTDGQGLMNAYQTQPTIMADGWYHMYLCLDENNKPNFAYHKYDPHGNIQLYVATSNHGE